YRLVSRLIDQGFENGDIYTSKHLVTVVFSLLGYWAVALFTKELVGWSFAPAAILILALTPRFWGHSFFNPKDIPFATLFILTSYVGSCFTTELLSTPAGLRSFFKLSSPLLRKSLFFGMMVGLLTGIRLGGFVVLGFAPLTMILLVIAQHIKQPQYSPSALSDSDESSLNRSVTTFKSSWFQQFPLFIICYGTVVIVWAVVTILLSPPSWAYPIHWFVSGITYLSSHQWEGVTLTWGQHLPAQPPWYYLLVWYGSTLPIITILLALTGIVSALKQLVSLSLSKQSFLLFLLLQLFGLPLIAILRGSTIYSGGRQFLFVLPAIAVFAVLGLAAIWSLLPNKFGKRAFLSGVVIVYLAVAMDMMHLHPYEYVFFNRLARGGEIENKFETDYWGVSVREAIEWVNQQPGDEKKVYFKSAGGSIKPFAEGNMTLNPIGDIETLNLDNAPDTFYYVASPRNKFGELPHPHDYFPSCDRVYAVTRSFNNREFPLAIVKKCVGEVEAS
ncbi:MAG: hypothetical protein AAGG02_05570, partial [Cyanobacteria bacterium P01_H01_bin.15]